VGNKFTWSNHRSRRANIRERLDHGLANQGWVHLYPNSLIKLVANDIPSYLMSLFLLPKSLCLEINSVLRKFWWGFPQDKKHYLSFLSWEKICQPKALRGLGICSMEFINNSLLARLGWKMLSNEPLL
jgi:hypothetical protein